MRKKSVVIWGTNYSINMYYNQITQGEENYQIVAFVIEDEHSDFIGTYRAIDKTQLCFLKYDFLIILDEYIWRLKKTELQSLRISEEKIIKGIVFKRKEFDFNKYINIKERNITIVSDDCWGTHVYNYLKLKFSSPFILFYIKPDDYLKLLCDFKYYMSCSLKKLSEGSYVQCPCGILGEDKKQVTLFFVHSANFEVAKYDYERRKQRINWKDIFVKMTIESDEQAYLFETIPFENKIGFYYKDINLKSICYLQEWENENIRKKFKYSFRDYVMETVKAIELETRKNIVPPFNIFKMLNIS